MFLPFFGALNQIVSSNIVTSSLGGGRRTEAGLNLSLACAQPNIHESIGHRECQLLQQPVMLRHFLKGGNLTQRPPSPCFLGICLFFSFSMFLLFWGRFRFLFQIFWGFPRPKGKAHRIVKGKKQGNPEKRGRGGSGLTQRNDIRVSTRMTVRDTLHPACHHRTVTQLLRRFWSPLNKERR